MGKIRKFIVDHDRKIHRALEILPGVVAYSMILFLLIGGFLIPTTVAYTVLAYDIFWLYKSVSIAITGILAHLRIEAAKKMDWLGEVKFFEDWRRVHHLIIIVTVNEPLHILRRNLKALAEQDFPLKQITVVIATEARAELGQQNAKILEKDCGKKFGNFFITVHKLASGEIIGKASNENYAARWAKQELVNRRGMDINYLTISSCDADHKYHPKHFSYLAYAFLDNPHRYRRFWQPAIQYYNNFWRLPALSRVANTIGGIWNMAVLTRTDRLVNFQNYSTSLKMIDQVGYWDPDIIPEDYRIFFKCFYKFKGQVEVEPIFLPLQVDAAESTTFLKTFKNQYEQFKRWAWGVSDDPYIIKNYFLTPGVSFWNKTIRVVRIVEDHFLWPVNWFFITLGITLPSIFNRRFSRTIMGYTLPRLSSTILSFTLIFMVIILIIDAKQRPPRPKEFPRWRVWLIPLEFILMPIAGFFFTALPGLDAQTRLMLGKYLEYRVTEKV
ncbi:MAG TPA: glycosyltransferase family 2 protein [Candidatus Bathyarchaeia archaeon]|nr:glycosyltransferase family 2 protein [Candidatus Bathyarchaeia archaeon]